MYHDFGACCLKLVLLGKKDSPVSIDFSDIEYRWV